MEIYQNNLGTISLTDHVQGLCMVKHGPIKDHYVSESVNTRHVTVEYMPSARNRAHSLTKALVGETFENHRNWLPVQDIVRLQ